MSKSTNKQNHRFIYNQDTKRWIQNIVDEITPETDIYNEFVLMLGGDFIAKLDAQILCELFSKWRNESSSQKEHYCSLFYQELHRALNRTIHRKQATALCKQINPFN